MRLSIITLGLVLLLVTSGLVGYKTYLNNGLDWRQTSNLPMTTKKLQEEQNKYWWSGSLDQRFSTGSPKVIVYGDSQAFDIFSALKNNSNIGLIYFPHSFKCSAFFTPNIGFDGSPQLCRSFFNTLVQSKEIEKAQYLIYAHEWEKAYETPTNYSVAIDAIRKINPQIKMIFFGPKPYLGSGKTINELLRNQSTFKVNEYLNTIKKMDDQNNAYAKELAQKLGVEYVDVSALFCEKNCPFYVDNQFSYFDSNHWTQEGAKQFYEQLSKSLDFLR